MYKNNHTRITHIVVYFLVISLVLYGCAANNTGNLPSKAYVTATNDANNPDAQSSSSVNNAGTSDQLLGEVLTLNNYSLAIPLGWYFSEVNRPNLHGWIFTAQDPAVTQENGFVDWGGAFWALTPLPAGTSAEEFTSSLQNQNFNNSDFSALLLPSEQAGLVDLTDAEATLGGVEISSWNGQPCLIMNGSINFPDSDNLTLNATIVLMAVTQDFVSYFQFSNSSVTSQFDPLFKASFDSFTIN